MKNEFIFDYLKLIKFKYSGYSKRLYLNNPNKDNLLGILQTLNALGFRANGYKLSNASDLLEVNLPAIAVLDKDFIAITSVNSNSIEYLCGGNINSMGLEAFMKQWNKKIIEVNGDVRLEPNFYKHKQKEVLGLSCKFIFYLAFISFLGILSFRSHIWQSYKSIILGAISGLGIAICCLLYIEHLNIQNKAIQKVCGIIKNSDCFKVSSSRGAKIFGVFHLSEIGLAFFTVNFFSIFFFNCNLQVLFLFSILSLPFCLWSPLYQKFAIKSWCTLCLCTIFVLLVSFGVFLLFGYDLSSLINFELNDWLTVILLSSCYFVAAFLLNILTSFIKKEMVKDNEISEYKDLKYDPIVFSSLLNNSPKLKSLPPVSFMFGNTNSKTVITVVSNPYCLSCVANHSFLKKIINDGYSIKLVLTAFNEELLFVNYSFMAIYQQCGQKATWEILSKWYEDKRKEKSFFDDYDFQINDSVKKSVLEQLEWITREDIKATPANFLNGSMIPSQYNLSELQNLNIL